MSVIWSKEEIDYLRQYYPQSGSIGCSNFIDRPISAIKDKASCLGVNTKCRNGRVGKQSIFTIVNNLVTADCQKHGLSKHRSRPGRSPRCCVCRSEYVRTTKTRTLNKESEYRMRKDSKRLYSHRLRVQLRQAIRNKKIGCFRFLPYSPKDLRKHLDDIKESQNNCCPSCNILYDISGFHIDHIIPLASAKTDEEILALFKLENLSLLCGPCNCSKGQFPMMCGV